MANWYLVHAVSCRENHEKTGIHLGEPCPRSQDPMDGWVDLWSPCGFGHSTRVLLGVSQERVELWVIVDSGVDYIKWRGFRRPYFYG